MNNLEIRGLEKEFKNFKLVTIDLDIPKGVIVGFIGENGSGKTTTIKLILDLIHKNKGDIKIFGENLSDNHDIINDIGVVFDELNLHEFLTAKDVDKIFSDLYYNWDSLKFYSLIEKMNIDHTKTIKEYSRGMKMKLALAMALSHDAKLLLLDEATSGLDPVVRDEILGMLMEFIQKEDNSVLISSHILSDLQKVADYIAFIHEGKMIFMEEKDALLENFGILYTNSKTADSLNPEGIVGRIDSDLNTKVLINRDYIPQGFQVEKPEIEDFMLYIRKGREHENFNN